MDADRPLWSEERLLFSAWMLLFRAAKDAWKPLSIFWTLDNEDVTLDNVPWMLDSDERRFPETTAMFSFKLPMA